MKLNDSHPIIATEILFEKKGKNSYTKRIFVNDKYCQLFGYFREEFKEQLLRNGFP